MGAVQPALAELTHRLRLTSPLQSIINPSMNKHQEDIQLVLDKRYANGADFWATPDVKVGVGEPFSVLTSLLILHELGVDASNEAVHGALELMLGWWREDGRIRVAPKGAIYPCYTSNVARTLCRYGLADDERLDTTFRQLLENRHDDGGWRCNRAPLGKSEITDASNPGVTLFALDALRFREAYRTAPEIDAAVDTLLDHWDIKQPLGPCQFGIGTLFKQSEYPFTRYNIFYYVYILSFYPRARKDKRFKEALQLLESKLDESGQIIIERPHRLLANFDFCKKGQPSAVATKRYQEIKANLKS